MTICANAAIMTPIPSKQREGETEMARKENIYTVSIESNLILRVSRTFQSAVEFAATLPVNSYYLCTSEFQCLKKGDPMSNIVESF